MKRKKTVLLLSSPILVLVIGLTLFLGAFSEPASASGLPKELVWGSRSSGDYNIQAMGFIKVVDKYMPTTVIFRAAANVASGVTMMRKGELDVYGAALRDFGLAYRGAGELKKLGKSDIRLMIGGRAAAIGFFTVPRTGAKRIEDIAGLRISYTSTRALVFNEVGKAILEYYGLLDKIKSIKNLAKKEKRAGLIEGTLDVSLEGVLGGSVLKWKTSVGVVPLGLSKECVEYVHKKCPYSEPIILPPGYGNVVEKEMITVAALGGVVCRKDLGDKTVYEILNTIYKHYNELLPIHRVFKDTVLKRAPTLSATVPYHPGAVKYFKEKGVWSPKMEALQKRLLSTQ